jgi:hypothetical protein
MTRITSGFFQKVYPKYHFGKFFGSKWLLEPLYKPFWTAHDFKMADRIQIMEK